MQEEEATTRTKGTKIVLKILHSRKSVEKSIMAKFLMITATLIMVTLAAAQSIRPVKILGFKDLGANDRYEVTLMDSKIRVTRDREVVQTIKFTASPVDFDLQCTSTHCYLVVVTNSSRQNIELFGWHRTQFDLKSKRYSFSKPNAVKLIRIQSGFYIVIAQEQVHLSVAKDQESEEPAKFVGAAVLKFIQGHPDKLKYHQFIRLPFNPLHVHHFVSINSNNATSLAIARPIENHHIVFSISHNWVDAQSGATQSYIWSPLDDSFWPHRIPQGAEISSRVPGGHLVHFPSNLPVQVNLTYPQPTQDLVGPVETCFHQLQRLLADREIQARQLLETSKSIWRLNQNTGSPLTNISAQVIVHGNVTVLGSLIESPQISLIAGHSSPFVDPPSNRKVSHLINTHSPAIVENKFKQAIFKLEHMRQKLSRAVLANLMPGSLSVFNDQVRFFGNIEAQEVIFQGIENSNVRLNGIPFRQLQHELVSLSGIQDIGTKVVFDGRVVADKLEIHGTINDYHYLKDAIDITSRHVQIIDASGHNQVSNSPGLSRFSFESVSTPDVIMVPNATINLIRLEDFITRDNRTQFVFGRKSFKRLSMSKLDLANPDVPLNNFNIFQMSRNAIHLRSIDGRSHQKFSGQPVTFMRGVQAKRVFLNNMINRHINLTSLIYDSVKADDSGLQQIYGQKDFLSLLHINRLNTEGALNGIQVSEIFNLNPAPPLPEHQRFAGSSSSPVDAPITGEFVFKGPVSVQGSLSTALVNGIDLTSRAVRRTASAQSMNASTPQLVRGHKTFYKPVRIMSSLRLLEAQEVAALLRTNVSIPYPLINNIDLRLITAGLMRQKQRPSLINVDDLEIDGDLNLPDSLDRRGPPRITLGNYSVCPLDLIARRLVLANVENQTVETPIRINSLRARSVSIGDDALNGLNFPQDFVLRSPGSNNYEVVEAVFGNKFIDHLIISPSNISPRFGLNGNGKPGGVVFGRGVNMNGVDYTSLQTFIMNERQHNSTGEKVFNTMNVHGNLYSSRINGHRWPDDILLKSVSSRLDMRSSPYIHKRIYSHLIFLNSSTLHIDGQLVLRGPVQLNGRLNGVNLTDFSRHSATYGDKDLYSISRPIRNKVFLGGITVRGEIRSQGLVDGINFEEMKQRVVTINPRRDRSIIISPKMFMSDTTFQSPIDINLLDDIPLDLYLRNVHYEHDKQTLRVFGKKTVTGALRINRNLFVHGLINGVDFTELQARAISLAPRNELTFNKTLTVEGDVFMDNLWIDERNGTIDGVELKNLLPAGAIGNNHVALPAPRIHRRADPHAGFLNADGTFLDCQLSCNQPQPITRRNSMPTRTTPPYSYEPAVTSQQPTVRNQFKREVVHPAQHGQIPILMQRTPIAINYEGRKLLQKPSFVYANDAIVRNRLDNLRQILRVSTSGEIVVGFIGAPTNDVSTLELPEEEPPRWGHSPKSYLQLDQIDFPYILPKIYHLSVGVATNHLGKNVTAVLSSLGEGEPQESLLPVEFPNSAKFLKIPDRSTLFLLISQDYSITTGMCATAGTIANELRIANQPSYEGINSRRSESGIHVYLFIALQNSSSYTSAYFDLYQTIDLPGIDSFEQFSYRGSAYVLAISRSVGRIYLLMLRGYSGFQIVSHIDIPTIERVTLMFTQDHKPILVIHQTSGMHRLMEPVII